MCTTLARGPSDYEDGGDLWADGSDDGEGAERRELDREATVRHQRFYNAGYREGLDEGKERTLQEGFNLGFREGAAAGFEWGLLRGAVLTLVALDGQVVGTRVLADEIQALKVVAKVPPREAMLAIFRHVLFSSSPQPPHKPRALHPHPQRGSTAGTHQAPAPDDSPLYSSLADAAAPGDAGFSTSSSEALALDVERLTGAFSPVTGVLSSPLSSAAAQQPPPAAATGQAAAVTACKPGRTLAGGAVADEGQSGEAEGVTDAAALGGASGVKTTAISAGQRTPPGETASAAKASNDESGVRQAGSTGAAPAALPPDAAALELPDMASIMTNLRSRLESLGIQVGVAPGYPHGKASGPSTTGAAIC